MQWAFELRVRFAPLNWMKPSSKIFYWPFQGGISFLDLLCFCSVLCLLCLCARLFICVLWSPAGKGLTSWLSFVVSNGELSGVKCGTWLYRFLFYAPLLISVTSLWLLTCNAWVISNENQTMVIDREYLCNGLSEPDYGYWHVMYGLSAVRHRLWLLIELGYGQWEPDYGYWQGILVQWAFGTRFLLLTLNVWVMSNKNKDSSYWQNMFA